MKKNVLFLMGLFMAQCLYAQSPYVSYPDPQHPKEQILNGIISKYALINNSAYQWYGANANAYAPQPDYVSAMRDAAAADIQFIVFAGTWCEDSHFIIPKFFKLQEQAAFPDNRISFFAVDRNKKTIGNITTALGITNVPTIIVLKGGKEVGRVVEYGKTGQWDKELAQLLK